jgi:integrase
VPEDLLELRKEHVDLLNRWVYIKSGKTRAAKRRLKLTAESTAILGRRLSSKGPFVFPSRSAQRRRGAHWRVQAEVLEAGGLSFVPYDLRHTFATRAVIDGMPLPVLAATLGHANLRSITKYIHIGAADIDAETIRIEQVRLDRILADQANTFAGSLPPTPSGAGEQQSKPMNGNEGPKRGVND